MEALDITTTLKHRRGDTHQPRSRSNGVSLLCAAAHIPKPVCDWNGAGPMSEHGLTRDTHVSIKWNRSTYLAGAYTPKFSSHSIAMDVGLYGMFLRLFPFSLYIYSLARHTPVSPVPPAALSAVSECCRRCSSPEFIASGCFRQNSRKDSSCVLRLGCRLHDLLRVDPRCALHSTDT